MSVLATGFLVSLLGPFSALLLVARFRKTPAAATPLKPTPKHRDGGQK